MKVFVVVLALAGLAAGAVLDSEKVVEQPLGDVRTDSMSSAESGAQSVVKSGEHPGVQSVEHPDVQSGEHPGVQSGEHVMESAVKPEHPVTPPQHMTFNVFGAPHIHHHHHHHGRNEFTLMRKILEGPVMVAYYDMSPAVGGKMQAFVLPNGLEDMTRYDHEEISPLIRFLTNGRSKSFLYPSAINYLRMPELFLPLRELHLPSHNLNTAFRMTQDHSSLPYVFISDDESMLNNNLKEKLDSLREMGVFGLQDEGFKILRDNYPRDSLEDIVAVVAHADPVRSVEFVVAVPTPVAAYVEEPRIHRDDKFIGFI